MQSRFKIISAILAMALAEPCLAQSPQPWSALAARAIETDPPSASWDTETGLRLLALEAEWYNTAEGSYFAYAKNSVDTLLSKPDPAKTAAGSHLASALFGQQLMLLYRATRDPRYFQAARRLRADAPSPTAPDRSIDLAWTAVSIVDALDSYPAGDPSRSQALAIFRKAATQLARTPAGSNPTSTWLSTYALLKGVRLGYLSPAFRASALGAWRSSLSRYVHVDAAGHLAISPAASGHQAPGNLPSASLGAFLLASTEVDLAPDSRAGHGAVVLLDAWFNSQQRKNAAGQLEPYHYKWTDFSDSGYSLFGHMLRSRGLKTQTLPAAPTAENLRNASYYLIVSPDIPVKNPKPNYMTNADADAIVAWVRRGGVLILMENDPPNADIEHLNLLADRFGIHFDNVLHHHVLGDRVHGDHVEDGTIPVAGGGPLFHRQHTLYMKDTCAISLSGSATALLRDRGDVVMATAHYGRGTVFANVDPWLYNEYTDGRNNPAVYNQFDNFAGGKELVRWLVEQHSQSPAPPKKETHP